MQIQSTQHKQQKSACDMFLNQKKMHFDNIFEQLQKTVTQFLQHQVCLVPITENISWEISISSPMTPITSDIPDKYTTTE